MANFNKVILAGNFTRDPELRYTPKGTAIARIGMAINRTWKTETGIFGVDGFDKLESGKSNAWTRDLESVLNDTTEFRVTYAHHIGGSKWGSDILAATGNFTCREGLKKTVTLTK